MKNIRYLKQVKSTDINWYNRKTITVKGVVYPIVNVHYKQLENLWIIGVEV